MGRWVFGGVALLLAEACGGQVSSANSTEAPPTIGQSVPDGSAQTPPSSAIVAAAGSDGARPDAADVKAPDVAVDGAPSSRPDDGAAPPLDSGARFEVPEASAADALVYVDAGPFGDGSAAGPEAFVNSRMYPGSSGICRSIGSLVQIGSATSTPPAVVQDGQTIGEGGVAAVQCSVTPTDGGFILDLVALLSGPGESFQLSAAPGAGVSTDGGSNVSVDLAYGTLLWGATDCTFSYTYNGAPIATTGGPIDPGRIWGHVSCPQATSTTMLIVNGMIESEQCDLEADFLFENCAR